MKRIRTVFAILTVLIMVLGLAACKSTANELSNSAAKESQTESEETLADSNPETKPSDSSIVSGDLDARHYKVSPLFGDVSDMPKMLLFVGTREIFYPDVISFYEKLHSAGTKAELIIGQNMNHVYPLYPIPEAKTAFGRIIKELA